MRKTRFLDKEKVIAKLSKLAKKAKGKNRNILHVILFGSLVNNTYTAASDADILVILKRDSSRFMDRIPDLLYLFADAPLPVDVFPYTEQESRSIPFARKAMERGIILA